MSLAVMRTKHSRMTINLPLRARGAISRELPTPNALPATRICRPALTLFRKSGYEYSIQWSRLQLALFQMKLCILSSPLTCQSFICQCRSKELGWGELGKIQRYWKL